MKYRALIIQRKKKRIERNEVRKEEKVRVEKEKKKKEGTGLRKYEIREGGRKYGRDR